MNNLYPHLIQTQEKRLLLVACEIMFREICYLLSQTHNVIDVIFLQKGLHDMGEEKMRALIQAELDKADPDKYEAVLLGYGLCNNGVRNLKCKIKMVIPKAHDCITLFLGSKKRYEEYFNANPGTYYKTSGWIERENTIAFEDSITAKLGLKMTYKELVEEYGEDNAQYLIEELGGWTKNYTKMTFIDMNVIGSDGSIITFGNSEQHVKLTKRKAEELGWKFENIKGDIRLIDKLLNREWNDDEFLTVPPERAIVPAHNNDILTYE